jgi:hypothetical protein
MRSPKKQLHPINRNYGLIKIIWASHHPKKRAIYFASIRPFIGMLSGCPRYFGNLLPSFSRASRYYKNSIQLFRVFPFSDNGKKAKYLPLAPIKAKILISRGSAYKIVAESGTILPKKPNVSAPKN